MLTDRTAEEERAAVVAWLRQRALEHANTPPENWPEWRAFLWALVHPIKFERSYAALIALHNASLAIERGDHAGGVG